MVSVHSARPEPCCVLSAKPWHLAGRFRLTLESGLVTSVLEASILPVAACFAYGHITCSPWRCFSAFPFCAISKDLQSHFPRLGFSLGTVFRFLIHCFPLSVWDATASSPGVSLCFSWPRSSGSRQSAHELPWTLVHSLRAGRAGLALFPAPSTFTPAFSEERGLSLCCTWGSVGLVT